MNTTTRFSEQDTDAISSALIAELERLGIETEYWNTGGGCMMVAAIISREGGTAETRMGEPTGRSLAVRYVGVTHEGANSGWMIFAYDEQSEDPADTDGVPLIAPDRSRDVIDPDRPDLAASFIAGYVRAAKGESL